MTKPSAYQREAGARRPRVHGLAAALLGGALAAAGCAHVTPQQQRLVSKPNMQFYRSAMFNTQNRLLSQVETSLTTSAGGPSSGGSCGSCGD